MNKFIKSVSRNSYTGKINGCEYEDHLFPSVIGSLFDNNTFFPNIDHVVYTLKTEDNKARRDKDGNLVIDKKTGRPVRDIKKLDNPVLTTTVYFVDGSKSTVVNSYLDPISLTKDGTDATEASKETGVIYAIAKRLFGKIDESGNVDGSGFGRKLRDIVDAGTKTDCKNSKRLAKEALKNSPKEPPKDSKVKKSVMPRRDSKGHFIKK